MTETIREQIIDNVASKITEIRTSKGYRTNIGASVAKARQEFNAGELPVIVEWPSRETVTFENKAEVHLMLMRIIGIKAIQDGDPSDLHEQMFADIVENIIGDKWVVDFTSGGTHEPVVGDTIEGATSGATGYIEAVEVSSGAWADGDAAGDITIRRKNGVFQAENVDIGTNSNVFTIDGTLTHRSPLYTTTGDLAQDIKMIAGGTDEYPAGADEGVKAPVEFLIEYVTAKGNPYRQITA